MLKRKFVGIGVALALGIFVVFAWRYISAGFAVGVVVFAGLVLLANFVYLVVFKDTGVGANVRAQQFFKANGLFIIVCLFFFLVGGVYFGVVMGRVERLHDSRFLYSEVNIGGVIEEVSPTEYGKRLIVRRVEVSYAGRVSRVGSKISVHMRTDALVPLRSGYHIRLYGVRLQASEVIRFNNLNTNAIINNIHFHVWLWDAGRLEQDGSSFSLRVKDYWSYVLHTVAPPDEAGFLYALVFGDRRYLSADFVESFRYAGLLHIMAVSGLHISIFGVMLSFLLRRMRIKGWANFIVSAIIFILYAWLCSFSPSVMRAVIMSLVFIASLNLGRRTDALNTLFFAGTLILLLNPVFLFDIAFLLSFSVVFGIICLTRPIALWLSKFAGFIKGLGSDKDVVVQAKVNANIPSKKANFFAICISSSVGVLPASAHFFNYYPLLSLVSGIIVLPVLPLIYGATIVMLLLSTILIPIGFLGGFLGFIGIIFMPFRFVATYIIFMAETLAYERAELFVYSLGLLSVLFFVAIIYAGRYSPLQSRYKAVVVAVLSV
ncbi:MAG: ComEC/Rec2 family competence protein, partial [Firmicutes bacterium]|nr:ComEC/Rec2 family competence protein [Bacillota bacterium]